MAILRNRLKLNLRFISGVGAALLLLFAACPAQAMERLSVDFDYVKQRAQQLAASPYQASQVDIPEFMQTMDYNTYLEIRSDGAKKLWTDEKLPFRVSFWPLGYIFSNMVTIHEFTATHMQEVPFTPHFFDFGKFQDLAARIPPSMGYAGFQIYYPLTHVDQMEDVAVFLGSNYFRIAGAGTRFGISARALAINTTTGEEEFPDFREFWLGKPNSDAETLIFYALLDGPSVTGAYRFELVPGRETLVKVRMNLFFRRKVEQFGIAPLSSMFFFNENSVHKPLDYRPRVHDSDGLLIRQPDNTYIWQPLINPADKLVTTYHFKDPVGFGLCQRDRNFENYQDIDQGYQQRPSIWVEPGSGDWGQGSVVLYEFGINAETIDNVVAFWKPKNAPGPGTPFYAEYTLRCSGEERSPAGYVAATRVGGPVLRPDRHQYVVDFHGEELRELKSPHQLKAVMKASSGIRLEEPILVRNPFNGGWRLILQFSKADGTPDEGKLTAFLTYNGQRVTETWSYVWTEEQTFPATPYRILTKDFLNRTDGTRPTEE